MDDRTDFSGADLSEAFFNVDDFRIGNVNLSRVEKSKLTGNGAAVLQIHVSRDLSEAWTNN